MAFDQDKWLRRILLSSIPLRKIDSRWNPIGIASGCLIDYRGFRIILSVFHATKRDGNWAIEIGYKVGEGTQLYKPGMFHHLGKMTVGCSEVEEVDFSYREVQSDLQSYFQGAIPPDKIEREMPREIFEPTFDIEPRDSEIYGFSGQVFPEFHEPSAFVTEMRVYPGLKYIRTEGDYHVFELPVSHPGHEHFEGCSGAPILDTQGNPVALVCSGDADRNVIFGISLARYRTVLDITYGGRGNA